MGDVHRSGGPAGSLVFAYGSLLAADIQDFLFGRVTARPARAVMSQRAGYARVWTLNPSGDPRVGVYAADDRFRAADVNGVMFELSDDELSSFQVYELPTYVPSRVPSRFFRVCDSARMRSLVRKRKTVLVYRPTFEYRPMDIRKYIPDVYVSTVLDGFRRYGPSYVQCFLRLTFYQKDQDDSVREGCTMSKTYTGLV